MHKQTAPDLLDIHSFLRSFPHCDQRILHAPHECGVCDLHPQWQALRQAWGIAFTGYTPDGKELPDPATHARGEVVNAWPGNRVTPPDGGWVSASINGKSLSKKELDKVNAKNLEDIDPK